MIDLVRITCNKRGVLKIVAFVENQTYRLYSIQAVALVWKVERRQCSVAEFNDHECVMPMDGMDYRFANQTIFTHTTGQIAESRDEVYIVAGNNLVAEKYVENTNTWEEVSRMNTVVKYLWYTEFGMASMLNKIFTFGGMYGDDIDHIWENGIYWINLILLLRLLDGLQKYSLKRNAETMCS